VNVISKGGLFEKASKYPDARSALQVWFDTATSADWKNALGHAEPVEALRVLMEDRKLRQRDLIPVFGSSSVVSDVLNGKRSISKAHARKLAEFFHVPVSLFI